MRLVEVPAAWRQRVRIVADIDSGDIRSWLSAAERSDLAGMQRERQRSERAASRIAARLLAVDLGLTESAERITFDKEGERPVMLLDGEASRWHVSFSHTAGTGAAALGREPVGFDLEHLRPIAPRATRFFLSPGELASAEGCAMPDALLHFWCAKEAAFKLQSKESTLLKVPLRLLSQCDTGLSFELDRGRVDTTTLEGGLVAALAFS